MQLVIRRSQADVKEVFGGHKGVQFSLYYRLVLTPEEDALVQRYQLNIHALCPFTGDRASGGAGRG